MAEYLAGSSNSLGYAIKPAADNLDYASVYGYCIIIVLLVFIIEYLPKLIVKIIDRINSNKKQIK
jgi:ABC-type nitrate/sulfonate/bicarbonate transport system permease component